MKDYQKLMEYFFQNQKELFIQWFQLYLGSVLTALAVTIGGLLWSSAFIGWKFSLGRISTVTILIFPLVLFILLFVSFYAKSVLFFESYYVRLLITLLIVSGTGTSMGIFFPLGMRAARRMFPGNEPILAGLNGGAFAIAIPAGFYIASAWGFFPLILIAGGIYFLSAAAISFYR